MLTSSDTLSDWSDGTYVGIVPESSALNCGAPYAHDRINGTCVHTYIPCIFVIASSL